MARPTQYQKLSLQLDAENKKLKEKLNKTQQQLKGLRSGAKGASADFKSSFNQMGGAAGALNTKVSGLVGQLTTLHPAVVGLTAAGGALALAFQDLTAYTDTWEGSLSEAGQQLTALQDGTQTFFGFMAEQRGKALAEDGLFGWVAEGWNQLQGLTTGQTLAAYGTQVGKADIVNKSLLEWQKGILATTVVQRQLRAETQGLYNQFRDKSILPVDRLKAVDTYKSKAEELFAIQKQNAEAELKYLEEQSMLQGNSFEDNLRIEQVKANIADLEREYLRLVGRSIEYENSITAELEKQVNAKQFLANTENLKDIDRKGIETDELDKPAEAKKEEKKQLAGIVQLEKKRGEQAKTLGEQLKDIQATNLKGLVAQGIAAAIKSALEFIPPPFNLVAAGTAAAGAMALFDKLVPSFDVGTDYVPHDMLAMVHKGERITPAKYNNGPENVEFILRGETLYGVIDEYNRRRDNSF